MNDLEKLFASELREIYDAEQQLAEALVGLEQQAASDQLKSAFHNHMEQTRVHISRLEEVFHSIGQTPGRKTCHGIAGIINEGEKLADEFKGSIPLDATLITTGQKAEHYEIVSYGSLCSWAEELENNEVLGLLKETLREEKAADTKLKQLARSVELEAKPRPQRKKAKGNTALNQMAAQNA